jgi:hypothetical protein
MIVKLGVIEDPCSGKIVAFMKGLGIMINLMVEVGLYKVMEASMKVTGRKDKDMDLVCVYLKMVPNLKVYGFIVNAVEPVMKSEPTVKRTRANLRIIKRLDKVLSIGLMEMYLKATLKMIKSMVKG